MNQTERHVLYLLASVILFIFSLTMMDFYQWGRIGSITAFQYWLSVGLTFVTFAFSLSLAVYAGSHIRGLKGEHLLGIFSSVILLFVAGVLDWFFYLFTLWYGKPYDYTWSAQYRWARQLGYSGWSHELELLWTSFWLGLLVLMWYKIFKK